MSQAEREITIISEKSHSEKINFGGLGETMAEGKLPTSNRNTETEREAVTSRTTADGVKIS